MTATQTVKPTTTYRTEAGNLLEAVRVNRRQAGVTPCYSVRVNGEHVGLLTGQRGHYSWKGQATYLTPGALTTRVLFDAASSLSGRAL